MTLNPEGTEVLGVKFLEAPIKSQKELQHFVDVGATDQEKPPYATRPENGAKISTAFCKEALGAVYEKTKWSRKSKIQDNSGQWVRSFVGGPGAAVVVTDSEDREILDVVLLNRLPDTDSLRKSGRPWAAFVCSQGA